jgi:hypothetical protein
MTDLKSKSHMAPPTKLLDRKPYRTYLESGEILRGDNLYCRKQEDMLAVLETAVGKVGASAWKKHAARFKRIRIGVAAGLTNGDCQGGAVCCEERCSSVL